MHRSLYVQLFTQHSAYIRRINPGCVMVCFEIAVKTAEIEYLTVIFGKWRYPDCTIPVKAFWAVHEDQKYRESHA